VEIKTKEVLIVLKNEKSQENKIENVKNDKIEL
jgi:hypothetical protein